MKREKKNNGEHGEVFEELKAPEGCNNSENGEKPKKDGGDRLKSPPLKTSKRIAYAAVGTAIAVVMATLTVFLPVRVAPLVAAAFCFFLVFVKCGPLYGVLTAAATELIAFFVGGISVTLILIAECFFPYSVLCFFIRRFTYRRLKSGLLRALIVIVFINAAFVAVYFTARGVLLGGMDIVGAVGKVGYALAALIVSALALVTDLLVTLCDTVITPKL